VSHNNKNDEEDDNSNGGSSQEELYNILYCNCPCHTNKGPLVPPPPPPPPPPTLGGYFGEGTIQFAMWGYY